MTKPNIKKVVKWLIILATTAWIISFLLQQPQQSWQALRNMDPVGLLVATILGIASLAHNAIIFHTLINRKEMALNKLEASSIFFNAQIAKNLPGRIWGIVYQLNHSSMEKTPKHHLVQANLEHMGLVLFGSSAFFIAFFALSASITAATVIFCLSMLAIIPIWQSVALYNVLNQLTARIPILRKYKDISFSPPSKNAVRKSILVHLSSWFFYAGAWYFLLDSINPVSLQATLQTLGAYTGAWIIGFLSFITPSGLGVRESAFVLISSHQSTLESLAFIAILSRLWLLFIEILLSLLFFALVSFYEKRSTSLR
ncbi:MAG: flippase-like domain-containing protein [Pseudomonadales bacterium]|nr:flippase-like domain-containing protein [Pseudomonadales bacterium]